MQTSLKSLYFIPKVRVGETNKQQREEATFFGDTDLGRDDIVRCIVSTAWLIIRCPFVNAK